MPAAASAVGGAAKKSKSKKPKSTKPKSAKPKTAKPKTAKPKSHDAEYYKKKAKALGIPLSKDGKAKTKKQLQHAISYRSA